MLPAGFEPATPASDRPQTLVLDRSTTGIGGIRFPTAQPVASRYTDWAIQVQNVVGLHWSRYVICLQATASERGNIWLFLLSTSWNR